MLQILITYCLSLIDDPQSKDHSCNLLKKFHTQQWEIALSFVLSYKIVRPGYLHSSPGWQYGSLDVVVFATSYMLTLQWMRDIDGKYDIVIIIPVL
jgi:hypothetical protein